MPLLDLDLPADPSDLPGDVRSFLREAERRVERFQRTGRAPAFVPSDYRRAYSALRALAAVDLAPGRLFCEWGSGFGVVACLATMLDFDACGIEIEDELVDAARRLAADFGLPVDFLHGSFVPLGGEDCLETCGAFAWLTTDEGTTHNELGLAPDDFQVIFAYPWPDEERATADLFERYAAAGAVLVTYHGGECFRLRRKMRRRCRQGNGERSSFRSSSRTK
jgi:hypothetical protein